MVSVDVGVTDVGCGAPDAAAVCGVMPRAEGGTGLGLPLGATRMTWVMFWWVLVPGMGSAAQAATAALSD